MKFLHALWALAVRAAREIVVLDAGHVAELGGLVAARAGRLAGTRHLREAEKKMALP